MTRCIKRGGVAVHTTEFNLSSNEETVENGNSALYGEGRILRKYWKN